MEWKLKSREREPVYKSRDAISLRGIYSLASTFPPFSQLSARGKRIKSAGCLATQPVPAHPIKHFYPIRIQDFHKFARFSGASAIKHRTRGGNAPWKYSAVTSRGCVTHGRLAEFWRILFLGQRNCYFLCLSMRHGSFVRERRLVRVTYEPLSLLLRKEWPVFSIMCDRP